MIRATFFGALLAVAALSGCANDAQISDARLYRKLHAACATYEKPLVQIGLELVPQAAAIKAALDPYVMPICRDILAVNDPSAPGWVMEQARKIRAAPIK